MLWPSTILIILGCKMNKTETLSHSPFFSSSHLICFGGVTSLPQVSSWVFNSASTQKRSNLLVGAWLHLSSTSCLPSFRITNVRVMEKRLRLANNFALKKCTRRVCTPEDLISQLPDEILVYILSFLSLKEAADTSVISRRWLSLWTYIPRLDFDAAKPLDEVARKPKFRKMHRRKYVRWVNHTLRMCKIERLEQFRVFFDLNKFAQPHIDKWLEFAFARQVQRVELDLSRHGHDTQYSDNCYSFPAQLLNLGDCARLNDPDKLPPFWNNFKSVKVLLLKSVDVTGEALEFFLHDCPFLEQMVVHGSRSLVNLEVVGPSLMLKHLEIWWCLEVKSLKICDTNLVRLGTSAGDRLLLSNVPMLIEVDILGCPLRRILDEILLWFSCVLSQLEVLTIHTTNGLEYFKNYKFPKLTKLKKFVLVVDAREDMSLLGCTDVIRAAPQLREFEFQFLWIDYLRSEGREYKRAVRRPHHHLKVLRVAGYHGCTGVVEVVRYFLKNAITLEKIIVDPHNQYPWRGPLSRSRIKEAQSARNEAKLQLEGKVPPHVELVIL